MALAVTASQEPQVEKALHFPSDEETLGMEDLIRA